MTFCSWRFSWDWLDWLVGRPKPKIVHLKRGATYTINGELFAIEHVGTTGMVMRLVDTTVTIIEDE